MPMTVKCSHCGALADAPDGSLGHQAQCLQCAAVFSIDADTVHSPTAGVDSDDEIPVARPPRVIPRVVRTYGWIYCVLGGLLALYVLGATVLDLMADPSVIDSVYVIVWFFTGAILF